MPAHPSVLCTLAQVIDPNAFHLDWDRTFEALAAIVVLSILIERALSLLFETSWWLGNERLRAAREPIAFALSFGVCFWLKFDALAIIILQERPHLLGYAITGAVIAGGSKGSVKLFRDVFNFKSSAYKRYEETKEGQAGPGPQASVKPTTVRDIRTATGGGP